MLKPQTQTCGMRNVVTLDLILRLSLCPQNDCVATQILSPTHCSPRTLNPVHPEFPVHGRPPQPPWSITSGRGTPHFPQWFHFTASKQHTFFNNGNKKSSVACTLTAKGAEYRYEYVGAFNCSLSGHWHASPSRGQHQTTYGRLQPSMSNRPTRSKVRAVRSISMGDGYGGQRLQMAFNDVLVSMTSGSSAQMLTFLLFSPKEP